MKKVTLEDRKKIKSWVRKCMNQLKKKEYPLPVTRYHVDRAVKLTKVIDNPRNSGGNLAGAYRIQINLSYWQYRPDCWVNGIKEEYDAFAKNKVYGNRVVTDLDDRIFISVAHEVSHYVQQAVMRSQGIYRKSHGDGFQRIYRWLRQDLVNPIIDAKIAELEKKKQLKNTAKFKQMDLPMEGEEFKLVA